MDVGHDSYLHLMHYIRHTLLAALLLSSLATQAQEYTPAQLQAFTQVFWEMKNNTQRTDQIESVPGISNDRLGEIIRAQATGQGVVLTPSEVIAVDNYKSRIDEYHDSRLSTLDSLLSLRPAPFAFPY